MVRWATTVRIPSGDRWLKENPLHGIRFIKEANPKRPVATWERFSKTREALQELTRESKVDTDLERWVKLEFALVVAEATGRRIGSIRQLRWEDFDLEREAVRWRADADKMGYESVTPLPKALLDEIREFRHKLGAIGGWVFGRISDGEEPFDRHYLDRWLRFAEQHAGLEPLEGGLWHAYRRKWASERKALPLKDVAVAGGWKDVGTLLQCYQQPDHETLLAVMSEPKKLREHATRR